MTLTKDTPVAENQQPDPNDPQKTATGKATSPGGGSAPAMDQNDLTAGQESYPGDRPAGENNTSGTPGA